MTRNIFDQYEQPENRLTHALMVTLDEDRTLLVPFLRWLGVADIPSKSRLSVVEQQVPGELVDDWDNEERDGLPDGAIHDGNDWAVLIEVKVQAPVSSDQVRRHRETAARHGYTRSTVVVIAVDEGKPGRADARVAWREVYQWFSKRSGASYWAKQFVEYMRVFEAKMLAKGYDIRGTLTMFDGIQFDDASPYHYQEAKRLLKLLLDDLQQRKDLLALGVDPKGGRRPAITGKSEGSVWDFLPLGTETAGEPFTASPHLTLSINRDETVAALTVPNGVKGGFRTKLKELGCDGFLDLCRQLNSRLEKVRTKSPGSQAMIYALQRHYKSQRSVANVDARLNADLRTVVEDETDGVKCQPEWIEAIYHVLVNKRSNVQLGVKVEFQYDCPIIRSAKATDLFADTWKALRPLLKFAKQGT